jgi:rhodanese-related sulfurtransferase
MTRNISVCELTSLEQHQPVQLVDVRSATEFKTGHVPGAINIPMDEVESRVADLSKTQPVILICQAGARAQIVANLLEGRREDVRVLQGGTTAWMAAGRPVVVGSKVRWSLERQVRLAAGILGLLGAVLAIALHPYWIGLSGFVGLGLTFAGLTDFCPMGLLLARAPWNRVARQTSVSAVTDGQACALRQ